MKKFWIQALKADEKAKEHPDDSLLWETLREGDDPAQLLRDFVQDVNDDFSEYDNKYSVRGFYFKLRESELRPAVCHNCFKEFDDEPSTGSCEFCCPKCRG